MVTIATGNLIFQDLMPWVNSFLSRTKFKIMQLLLEILHQMFKKVISCATCDPRFFTHFFYFLIAFIPGFFIKWA